MTVIAPQPIGPEPLAPDEITDPIGLVLYRCRPSTARATAAARALGHPVPEMAPDPQEHGRPSREAKPHLRVVDRTERTPAQRRRRARAVLAGSAILAVLLAFALVYFHVLLAQRQFQLDNLNSQVQQQQQTYQKLRLQVAQMGSPQNIISTAEGRLGMVQPTSVVYLTPSSTVGGSAPAASHHSTSGATAGPAGDANWPTIKSQLAGSP